MRHGLRSFVKELDFLTSLGHGRTGTERQSLGIKTKGPALLVTDLCIMAPDSSSREFVVISLHPGITRDQISANTGWDLKFAETVTETSAPDSGELAILRDLNARTERAHGRASVEA
jgi:glutaconate CoA-transferase subunit B